MENDILQPRWHIPNHQDATLSQSLSSPRLGASFATTPPTALEVASWPSSDLFAHPTSQSTQHQDTVPSTPGQQPTLPFYSTNKSHRHRKKQSNSQSSYGTHGSYSREFRSDTATAYSVRSAQYPVLYEKLKTPSAAKKAFNSWKRERDRDVNRAADASNALGSGPQGLVESHAGQDGNAQDAQASAGAVGDNARSGIEMQNLSRNSHSQGQTSHDGDAPGRSNSTVIVPTATRLDAVAIRELDAVAIREQTCPNSLPRQHMAFSEPVLKRFKRESHMLITCKLAQSYPNFHLECEYIYLDRSERVNATQTDTRISSATIRTRENIWVLALEQKGYNESFTRGLLGEEQYARLDRAGSDPVEGSAISETVAAPVTKKIVVPEGFDLAEIWCKPAGFYQVNIYVPEKKQ